MKRIRESTLVKRFCPVLNRISENGFSVGEGTMFETYGNDMKYVQSVNPALVWTILECDGKFYAASGFHFVNRFGYLVCTNPVPAGEEYEARV